MATPSVITELVRDMEDATWGRTPFKLSIKGSPERRVNVRETLNVDTGATTVEIVALTVDGKPVVPLSTLDQIARNIKTGARVQSTVKGSANMIRVYA
jgi:hypothetical protein